MKQFILYGFLLSCFYLPSYGQTLASLDTNKYRINLPSFWKPGNKTWKILSDKLPVICEEIREKDLCGDHCNPKYTLELEILEPIVIDYDYYCTNAAATGPVRDWVFFAYYNFQSSFLLLNENREIITRFIIVDTTETWALRKQERIYLPGEVTYRPGRPNLAVNTTALIRGQAQSTVLIPYIRYRDTFDPLAYIRDHRQFLSPSDLDLFTIIDKKIRAW